MPPTLASSTALPYDPLARQAAFHKSTADEVLFGGAAGPGKSLALLMELFHQAVEQPGSEVICFRRTYPQLEATLIKGSLEGFPGPGRPGKFPRELCSYNQGRHAWTFVHGSRLRFGHGQHKHSIREYQGQQFEGIGFDELTEWEEESYRFALRLLRSTNPRAWPRVRAASNPIGLGHLWVRQRFVQPYLDGVLDDDEVFLPDATDDDPEPMTRAFIPAKHSDNPLLLLADPGYLGRLKQLSLRDRVALLEGSWELPAFEGQVFAPDVIAGVAVEARGLEPARWRCGRCTLEWHDPTWKLEEPGQPTRVLLEGARTWAPEINYTAVPRCKVCDGRLTCRSYLTAWDVARKMDWCVGITVDLTDEPAQVVAFERFRRVPWPTIADRIAQRWACYPGTTLLDSTGVGDPLLGFLQVPTRGVLFSPKSKHDMLHSLLVLLEKGGLRAPLRGNGIEQLYRELSVYQFDDKELVQDCVMALAMLAPEIHRRGDLGATI